LISFVAAQLCAPDELGARLPFRWPQDEIGKNPAFAIAVTSD